MVRKPELRLSQALEVLKSTKELHLIGALSKR